MENRAKIAQRSSRSTSKASGVPKQTQTSSSKSPRAATPKEKNLAPEKKRPTRRKDQATSKKLSRQDIVTIILLVVWTVLALIASQFIVAYPMFWLLGEAVTTPFWTLIFYLLNYSLSLVLILVLPRKLFQLIKRRKNRKLDFDEEMLLSNPKDLGVGFWPSFVDIGLAPIGYFIYIVLASIATNFFRIFPWFNADQAQDVGFSYFVTSADRFFAMLAIVFIAPIAEEIIMRGWLYGKLRKKIKVWSAILITSLVFALLHGQLNVGVSVFILSVVLCGLREITGSVWSGVLLHILSNGIAFYMLYIAAGA